MPPEAREDDQQHRVGDAARPTTSAPARGLVAGGDPRGGEVGREPARGRAAGRRHGARRPPAGAARPRRRSPSRSPPWAGPRRRGPRGGSRRAPPRPRPPRASSRCPPRARVRWATRSRTVTPGRRTSTRARPWERHDLAAQVGAAQRGDGAVEEQAAAVDHEDAVADLLHVARVVGREEHGAAVLRAALAHEVADHRLRRHVEADRGLVEEQQVGRVEEARDDLAAHALAERQRLDGPVGRGRRAGTRRRGVARRSRGVARSWS